MGNALCDGAQVGPPGTWRRDTSPSDDDSMDITHVIESVFTDPDLYAAANAVPPRSKLKPGRYAYLPTVPWPASHRP